MHVLNSELDRDHHHLPAAVPEDDRPEVQAIQYVARNTCRLVLSPGGVIPHFAVRVYEPYVSVAVDGFTCGQEVNDSAGGPVDQLSVDEILKLPLIKL